MIKIELNNKTEKSSFSLLFTGDFCPINPTDLLIKKDIQNVFSWNLLELFEYSSVNVLNLEAPLTKARKGILKCGPQLKVKPSIAANLKKAGFDISCLANNHIRDFGPKGVRDTLKTLKDNGIKPFGAGKNPKEAAKPLSIKRKKTKLTFLAFAENEFSGADNPGGWGASTLNPIENLELITKTRQQSDVVIVVVHGGNEYCPFPSPRMVKLYRSFARAGATAVIGSHTHVPQGYELYKNVPIFYSLGNFVFPQPNKTKNPFWYRGYAVKLNFSGESIKDLEISGVLYNEKSQTVDLISGSEENKFDSYLSTLSSLISKPQKLEKLWNGWCVMNNPEGWLFRVLSAKWPIKTKQDLNNLAALENRIRCESHLELGQTFLRLKRNNKLSQARLSVPLVKKYMKGYL
jgi:poly-gamma-glutamate synthesis protein (capsule biosynthesis protein)